MGVAAVSSVNGVRIRLTAERWLHIVSRHPEMEPHKNRVIEAVRDPDFIAKGLHGELKAVRLFVDLEIGARYLIVVYRDAVLHDSILKSFLSRLFVLGLALWGCG